MAAIEATQVSVGTSTAVALNTAEGYRQRLFVQNLDATNPVYIGGSDVASSGSTGGLKLANATTLNHPITVPANEVVYAIATGGSVTVAVLTIPNV